MPMTFDQYINNPLIKRNPLFNNMVREHFRASYEKKWGILMVRERGTIDHFFYHDKVHNAYYAHIKVPSETVKRFYYDVVIKFTADQHVEAGGQDLFKYNVQFYSNDPAFCYFYAYAFNQHGMFIKELSKMMVKDCLTKKPKQKNPEENTGYVKTLFFAYLYMKANKFNQRDRFTATCMTYSYGHLVGNIEEAQTKITKRQDKTPDEKVPERKREEVSEKDKKKNSITKGIETVKKIEPIKKITAKKHTGTSNVNIIKARKSGKTNKK